MTTLLDYDLAVRRGGNKARLVARIYTAICNAPGNDDYLETYEEFRKVQIKWTYEKLHQVYDHMLPAEFRAKTGNQYGNAGRGRQAKQANGMTEAQQKQFDRFCKAPARLEKRFNKTAEYFLSCGNTEHLLAHAKRFIEAAEYCRTLIGDVQTLTGLWNTGMRTSGDLEMRIERALRI